MNVREYLLKYIAELKANTMTIEQLVNDFCNTFCVANGVPRTTELENYLTQVFEMYLNNEITDDEIIATFETIMNSNSSNVTDESSSSYESSGSSSGGGGGSRRSSSSGSTTSTTTRTVVDIDTDIIISLSNSLKGIGDTVEGATIDTTDVGTYAGDIQTVVDQAKNNIEAAIEEIKQMMTDYLSTVEDVDGNVRTIDISSVTFDDLAQIAREVKENGQVALATEEFFRSKGYDVVDNVVTIVKNGKTYKYNVVSHKFSVDGKVLDNVRFYIPNVSTEHSKLNVYTYFQEGDAPLPSQANAIGIEIKKISDRYGYSRYDPYYEQYSEVTKFMNEVVHTDRSTTRNIISGDSKCGAVALKVAAQSGDVYDTVYCVNNAVIVGGEGGNGKKGSKEQFATIDDLKKLDGKEIYFISSANDGNLDHTYKVGNGYAQCAHSDSYAYTGLKLICENCPNAKIYMIYDEVTANSQSTLQDIPGLLRGLECYSNYKYEASSWEQFAPVGLSHSNGEAFMNSLFSSKITAYNVNTVSSTA